MSSFEVKKYFKMHELLCQGTDEAIKEKILESMDTLWYFYLSPSDKELISTKLGEHTRKR